MQRIDFDTAKLMAEALPDLGSDTVWVADREGNFVAITSFRMWIMEYEPNGFKMYYAPFQERVIEALAELHNIYLWAEPYFEWESDPYPKCWKVFKRTKGGHKECIARAKEREDALERAIIKALKELKNKRKKTII